MLKIKLLSSYTNLDQISENNKYISSLQMSNALGRKQIEKSSLHMRKALEQEKYQTIINIIAYVHSLRLV
jgi:hypothetical protein